jgi:subtilisin
VAGTIGGINNGFGVYGSYPGVRILPVKVGFAPEPRACLPAPGPRPGAWGQPPARRSTQPGRALGPHPLPCPHRATHTPRPSPPPKKNQVLGDDGYGSMSDIMAAIDYVTTNAKSLGNVVVINMSLGGGGSPNDAICDSIAAAAARGIIVVVAAGNDNKNLASFSPAACPAAVTVTAIDATTNAPASFSNWASPSDNAQSRRVITAPGVNIVSTLPDGSYAAFSGTSMATPHVSGVAARCFAEGDCVPGDGTRNRERFLDAVWAQYKADVGYRWNQGSNVANGRYYGPLVFADAW